MADPIKKWGHDELAHDLAMHLKDPRRMVWEDMPLGPAGSSRPDVYTVQKSFVKPDPMTYEVKVSVSDFRSDITAGKWQNYFEFSGAVIFAVPHGLIKKGDIPTGCGFMVRSERGWSTQKRATRQKCELKSKHLLKLLMACHDSAQCELRVREVSVYRVAEKLRKEMGDRVADILLDQSEAERCLQNTLDRIEREKEAWSTTKHRMRERAESEARENARQATNIIRDACRALNLPENSSVWDLRKAMHDTLKRVDADKEVQYIRNILDDVYKELEKRHRMISV